MIFTKSAFYYGHTVNDTNSYIDFQEGANPVTFAILDVGEYSFNDFINAFAIALNRAGNLTYTVTANRATRIITITANGTFKLFGVTGINIGRGVLGLAGFYSDTALALSHTGTLASGAAWTPQFYAQDFVDFEDNQSAVDGVIKQSTSGKVESVSFGKKKIMECNFKFITNINQNNQHITTDILGVTKARTFMEYAVSKADMEFIPDASKPDVYVKCILESTPEDQNGLGFKLKEQYSSGLTGYFETGLLKFRKVA
jgi:hypothetical protein